MTAIVFLGPSLARCDAMPLLAADYRPPAAQGDVYRAALQGPKAIGLIDGYFERLPAVWHKEILWAMSQGIHVFGASSMGALRAAELAAFGMVGVGEIFEGYRSGALTDDDEVTVVHADASLDYRSMSVAMVDIRATVQAAIEAEQLTHENAQAVLDSAKSLFYVERNYPRIILEAAQQTEPGALECFTSWCPEHHVQLKRRDARQLLQTMAEWLQTKAQPKRVDFIFEHTDAFEQLVRSRRHVGTDHSDAAGEAGDVTTAAILDELRLDVTQYQQTAHAAWTRALALELADKRHIAVDDNTFQQTVVAFRRARNLMDAASTRGWYAANGLDRAEFAALLRDEARLLTMRELSARSIDEQLLNQLRVTDAWLPLARRARHKQRLLKQHGYEITDLASAGLTEQRLIDWYMKRLGTTNSHDRVVEHLRKLDCNDDYQFLRLALREYLYQTLTPADDALQRAQSLDSKP
ncbi:MAG: hypothetical protein RL701_5631 [Pseudomonadota bacterium]|jgi:hypothetical protein